MASVGSTKALLVASMINLRSFNVGGIGHCSLGNNGEPLFVQFCFHQILNELASKFSRLNAVSALATGADTVFAECAHRLAIPLASVIPFSGFEKDFLDAEAYARYRSIRDIVLLEECLHYNQRTGSAYRKSMEWVIVKSNLVIAAWDGQCIGSVGGTWEAVSLCDRLGKPMFHINTRKRSLSLRAGGIDRHGSPKELINDLTMRLLQ